MARRTQRAAPAESLREAKGFPLLRVLDALWENAGELWYLTTQLGGHVFVKDWALRFVYANEVFAADAHTTPEGLVGKTDLDLFPGSAGAGYQAADRDVMEKGKIVRDAATGWELVKVPIKDPEGRVVAIVGWSPWNVWRQHLLERLFHLSTVALSSADAIVGLTVDGIIQSWNPGAEELYGRASAEVLGQPITDLCDKRDRAAFAERLHDVAAGAVVRDFEMVHRRKDGRRVHVSATLAPLVGTYGSIAGVSLAARDVTQRVRMEEDLKSALAQLAGTHNELTRAAYARPRSRSPLREDIEHIAREIRQQPRRSFDFGAEARRLHISHSHFRQLFRDVMGRPPHDYLLLWRMRRAAQDLRDMTKPIKVVAMEAGYDDPAQFSRLFKEKIGLSPRQYRDATQKL